MTLTALEIARAKTEDTPQKRRDGHGLYIYITKKTKSYRTDYLCGGKRGTIVHGKHPDLSLAKARELNRETRRLLAAGINPATQKRLDKLALNASFGDSFEATAKHWYDAKESLRSKVWREAHGLYLRRDLNPYIGNVPLKQIDARTLLNVLEKARDKRGVRTAERVRQTAVQVFDHGMRKLKIHANPARILQGWIDLPQQLNRQPLREHEIPVLICTES
jgi:hypothetical protein